MVEIKCTTEEQANKWQIPPMNIPLIISVNLKKVQLSVKEGGTFTILLQ